MGVKLGLSQTESVRKQDAAEDTQTGASWFVLLSKHC